MVFFIHTPPGGQRAVSCLLSPRLHCLSQHPLCRMQTKIGHRKEKENAYPETIRTCWRSLLRNKLLTAALLRSGWPWLSLVIHMQQSFPSQLIVLASFCWIDMLLNMGARHNPQRTIKRGRGETCLLSPLGNEISVSNESVLLASAVLLRSHMKKDLTFCLDVREGRKE